MEGLNDLLRKDLVGLDTPIQMSKMIHCPKVDESS